MPALEVSGLVVRYGERTAVSGLSFTAEAGTITALLGPNGAGKTTTVETLEGYRRPDHGRVRVLELDPVEDRAQVVARMGVMLQRGGVYPAMNARQVLRLFSAYYRRPADPDDLIGRVGLAGVARTPWRRLSGGEQQRLGLALALIGRPEVVLLDEPTAGVDPAGRIAIRQVVAGLRAEGTCVLLTTHDMDEAERLADQVVIISAGRLVGQGSPAELMRSDPGRVIRFGAPPALDLSGLAAAMEAPLREEQPGEYVVDTEATPAAVARLTAWLAERDLPLSDLRAGRQSLEDVFLLLTGEDQG
ncbi:MAG TPA: ABC transporter ATP-binding protein [Acidimicrobiales bacterium]|nr:ABC transporter ATP-binding protein [Acidimicrobiales bacterium]